MQAPSLRSVAQILGLASGLLAIPTSAHAGFAGLKQLISTTQMQAANANEQTLEGATKQRTLLDEKRKIRGAQGQLEGASAQPDAEPPVSQAALVVQDVAAIAELESTASVDGLDDSEKKALGELVSVARQRVDAASAEATTAFADAKKELAAASDDTEKAQLELRMKALRAAVKAHKKTAASLRKLSKKLAT